MGTTAFIIFLMLTVLCVTSDVDPNPVVSIKSGKVKGKFFKSANGNDFAAFTAIPYSKPPVGELRFQPPEPVDSWGDKIFDATEIGNECPQSNFMGEGFQGDEDCLIINVYSRKLPSYGEVSLPVLVSIHGGGFISGSGSFSFFGPQKFMDQEVVLVTMNYRIGLLGFLNTEDEVAPGNYGMLDQVLALKWIQENIASFGGDPKKVAIFGDSAGGASVAYQVLSPLSKGLFSRAIAQSGSSVSHWAFQNKPLLWAKRLAQKINCPISNTKDLVECLKQKPASELVEGNKKLMVTSIIPFNAAPSVDGPGGKGFLPANPMTLLEKGLIGSKVPVITGITSDEGYIFYGDMAKYFPSKGKAFFDQDAAKYFSNLVDIHPDDKEISRKIQEEYFNGKSLDDAEDFEKGVVDILSDVTFDVGAQETVERFTAAGLPTRVYIYNQLSNLSTSMMMGGVAGKYVSHGDEVFLQFSILPSNAIKETDNDRKMSSMLNTIWTNFAAGKDDTLIEIDGEVIEWPVYDNNNPRYLEITLHPSMKDGKLCDRTKFWLETVPDLAKKHLKKDEL